MTLILFRLTSKWEQQKCIKTRQLWNMSKKYKWTNICDLIGIIIFVFCFSIVWRKNSQNWCHKRQPRKMRQHNNVKTQRNSQVSIVVFCLVAIDLTRHFHNENGGKMYKFKQSKSYFNRKQIKCMIIFWPQPSLPFQMRK